MPNWRDELNDAVKTRVEREAEEAAKQRQRVQEALASAQGALTLSLDALRFATERIAEKGQPAKLSENENGARIDLGTFSLVLELDRETAVIKVTFLEGKPREFDFARDRHIAAADVEEYVGRRTVELVRNAQKAQPW
jgi:hypothetical protein